MINNDKTLIERLLKRAKIRRNIPRSEPDRISDILEEAAERIKELEDNIHFYENLDFPLP
jgi:hypothetical protein